MIFICYFIRNRSTKILTNVVLDRFLPGYAGHCPRGLTTMPSRVVWDIGGGLIFFLSFKAKCGRWHICSKECSLNS